MTNDNRSDDDASLQKELEKESAEGKEAVGDAGSNRNLSGASTWDTLPDDQADTDSTEKSKDSGKKSG